MKKKHVVLMLFVALCWIDGYAQHTSLESWYDSIRLVTFSIRNKGEISVHKEVLYDGSIVPIAHGSFSYEKKGKSVDTVPFLYYYGRIIMPKPEFHQMIESSPGSTTVTVRMSFQPERIWTSQKTNSKSSSITFTTRISNIKDLYDNGDAISQVRSFWAITTIEDCYKVLYADYGKGGWYYHIPYKNVKRKRMMNKLDKLSKRQYYSGFYLLNFFSNNGVE